jgi:hypothetical protein
MVEKVNGKSIQALYALMKRPYQIDSMIWIYLTQWMTTVGLSSTWNYARTCLGSLFF